MPDRYNYEARVVQLHTAAYNAALDSGFLVEYWAPKIMALCPMLIDRENTRVAGKFNPTSLIITLIQSQTKGSTEIIGRLLRKYRQVSEKHTNIEMSRIWATVLDEISPLPVVEEG